jgi:hypothetical protein
MSATLEQRAAAALVNNDIASFELANLMAETEAAITAADQTAIEARELALDPVASPHPAKARAAMEDAAFTRDRLRNVLPRLQQRYDDVFSREEDTRWMIMYDAIKPEVDAAAEELRTVYTEFAAKLVPLLSRIEVIDREVRRVQQAKPINSRSGRYLLETELVARGLEQFRTYDHRITKDGLQLPDWDRPSKLAWPPYRGIDIASIVPIFQHPGDRWFEAQQEENARRRAEDEKRAEALREEEGRVRNNPKLWKTG